MIIRILQFFFVRSHPCGLHASASAAGSKTRRRKSKPKQPEKQGYTRNRTRVVT